MELIRMKLVNYFIDISGENYNRALLHQEINKEYYYSHRYKSLFAQICVSLLTHLPRAGHHSPIPCDQPATVNSNATE